MSRSTLVRASTTVFCCLSSVCGLASSEMSWSTREFVSMPEAMPEKLIVLILGSSIDEARRLAHHPARGVAAQRGASLVDRGEAGAEVGEAGACRSLVA